MCKRLVKTLIIVAISVLAITSTDTNACNAPIPQSTNKQIKYDITNDKRAFTRVPTNTMKYKLNIEGNGSTLNVIDISRGGVALTDNNKYNIGDIIPVKISYRDIQINSNIKIVRKEGKRLGAKFITDNNTVANKIMYLSIKLESDSGMLITRFSENGIL